MMELRRRAVKRWVPCGDMGRMLNIPHSAKVECEFRTTPEECLYDRIRIRIRILLFRNRYLAQSLKHV